MKQRLPLAQFSEPQAVLFLLGWLRLITTGLLLFFCGIAEFLNVEGIKTFLDWQLIFICSSIVICLSIFTHLFKHRDITKSHLVTVLFLDIICWSALISASGGSINPAISYLLVLLSIAALSLSGKQAFILTAITVILYAWIMNTQPQSHHGHMMGWHLWGMWVLFMLNAVIMLVVIILLGRALREKDKAIANYREETVRNEQLVSMGTMAANLAHELGTPLSTIAVLIDDIEHEDIHIIHQQIERCKNALAQLKTASVKFNESSLCTSEQFLARLVHETLLLKPDANIEWIDQVQQNLMISPLFEQALLALLNNAIDASEEIVDIKLYRESQTLVFDIMHDGEKVSESLLKVLGQKMVESKNGLGLGYYLANATIERWGGRLQIKNSPEGVLTRIEFPWDKVVA